MTTYEAGQSATIDIPANAQYTISTTDDAYVDIIAGVNGAGTSDRLFGNRKSKVYGPWGVTARITVRSIAGTVTVDDRVDRPVTATTNLTGGIELSGIIGSLPISAQSGIGRLGTSSVSHCGTGVPTGTTGANPAATMWQETLMLPCGVDAVQICPLINAVDASLATGLLGYVQTSDLSGTGADLKNPYLGGVAQTMQQVTWGGANSPVFSNAASVNNLSGVWSDWIPVVNTGAAPSYLILRRYYPAGFTANLGFYNVNAQAGRVSALQALGSNALYGYNGSNVGASNSAAIAVTGSAMPCLVRFASRKRVLSIGVYGDSTRQGWYSNGVVAASERYAASRSLAGKPTASNNRAITNQTGALYLSRLKADIANGDTFDVLVWQVASPNDGYSADISRQQISRAHEAIRIAESIGASIVLDGPYPMTASNPSASVSTVVNNAKAFCEDMHRVRPGIISALYDSLHDPVYYGKWIPGYNNAGDGLHQNEVATTDVILPSLSAAIDLSII